MKNSASPDIASGNNGSLQFYTNSSQTANTAAPERMRIDSSGNVGIGTTNPLAKLHIAGNPSDANITLQRTDNGSGATSLINFGGTSGGNYAPGSAIYAYGQDLMFKTDPTFDANDDLAERMRITNTGNVGIADHAVENAVRRRHDGNQRPHQRHS